MIAARTYGKLSYHRDLLDSKTNTLNKKGFVVSDATPDICIRLKAIFAKLPKHDIDRFVFTPSDQACHELLWFMDLYPLEISPKDLSKLKGGRKRFLRDIREMEEIVSGKLHTEIANLKNGYKARNYQLIARDIMMRTKSMILGDEMGVGKSLSATLCLMDPRTRPALVVCQSHMMDQWKEEVIEKFTNMTAFIITGFTPFKLPPADIYIINYHCLAKWISVLAKIIKAVVFDECQELRTGENSKGEKSEKYAAAEALCERTIYSWGLSGSPIYNYGIEIFNILNCIRGGCLGEKRDFQREWQAWGKSVAEPEALGSYLRNKFLMLRRTAEEVGRELPKINIVVQSVDYDTHEVEKSEELTRQLALSYMNASDYLVKGRLALQLDARARQDTGIAKAREVAALVKILLENNEPVILSGWHREVYEIWLHDLQDYAPVMFTGSEGNKAKKDAKRLFMEGKTNLFIISNRSGVGLDGLQYRCKYVVIGELDWSPKVHEQIYTRAHRDGQEHQVTVLYPICNYGSDPTIVNVLGLKAQQSHHIMDPMKPMATQYSDQDRIKLLAESYLKKQTGKK